MTLPYKSHQFLFIPENSLYIDDRKSAIHVFLFLFTPKDNLMMMSQISHSGLSPTFAQSQDKLTNEEVVQAAPALREAVQPCANRQAIAGVETGLHGTSQGKLVLRVWALHSSTRHGAAAI